VVQRSARPRGRGDRPVTVWRLLRRQQLGTRRARLAVLERASAVQAGVLTERTIKPVRHVAAAAPGNLLSLDTFYVGKLKGVGKVWQITGCDVASSFGWARVLVGEVTAAAVLAFLREVVRPACGQAERTHASYRLRRRDGRMNVWMKVSTPLRNWTR
jgi:hypothetical protein